MTSYIISKTTFLEYLYCSKNIWLKMHRPELLQKFRLSDFERHLVEQGNEVESCARNLFPGGIEVVSWGEDACTETVRLMTAKVPAIFQATFIVDGFIARNDALKWNSVSNCFDLYEVKGTNKVKENTEDRDHITDVAFQVSVLRRANISLGRYFIIHLNKEYVRQGDLDVHALFTTEDVTDKVHEKLADVEIHMSIAREYLSSEKEPHGSCVCIHVGRKRHCTTFKHSNPHVPDYSVHDLSGIREKKLNLLIAQGIFDLNDVPEEFELSQKQRNQICVHAHKKPIIESEKIQEKLSKLTFPLYFFDYEALAPAIPLFDGYGPYKTIPFQFSIHVLANSTAELSHVEFLHQECSDPSEKMAKLLNEHVFPGGTMISWHKSYEQRVNRELALRLPQYAPLMERINNSFYDLEEIFLDQHYIHPDFHGRTSIKKVLPALVPHLQYADLDIREGGQAADAWWTMISPATRPEARKKIAADLKTYCGLDTYAMYVIWRHLHEATVMKII